MSEALRYTPPQVDLIPAGTFSASETPEQVAALRVAQKIGEQIIGAFPQVANMYRDIDTFPSTLHIAFAVMPEETRNNPAVIKRAIGYALEELMKPEERIEITHERRKQQLLKNRGDLSVHQSQAARARHEQGIPVDTKAMIRARGRTPWDDEEKEIVLDLMIHDPEFQIPEGQWKGFPDYEKIAELLNAMYHDREPVRYKNSVLSMVHDYSRKK